MSKLETIDRLCRVISEQAEIISDQAALIGQLGGDSGELFDRRKAVAREILDILKERAV